LIAASPSVAALFSVSQRYDLPVMAFGIFAEGGIIFSRTVDVADISIGLGNDLSVFSIRSPIIARL
jgi:hypothetical protein